MNDDKRLEMLARDQRALYILLTIACPILIFWWLFEWMNKAAKK